MALKMNETGTGYLDILRVYACIAVIVYHVFSNIIGFFNEALTESEYFLCAVLVNIWLWHVPTFVMISGVIFLNKTKEVTIKQLLRKYVLRIIRCSICLYGITF